MDRIPTPELEPDFQTYGFDPESTDKDVDVVLRLKWQPKPKVPGPFVNAFIRCSIACCLYWGGRVKRVAFSGCLSLPNLQFASPVNVGELL
jgi:hypothetical protein